MSWKQSAWKVATAVVGVVALVVAVANLVIQHFQLGSSLDTNQLLNIVLGTTSVLLVASVIERSSQTEEYEELKKCLLANSGSDVSEGRLAETALSRVDPKLRPMFEQHLRSVIRQIVEAHDMRTVTFTEPHLFKAYYLAVLQAFPKDEKLTATSLPLGRYFWDGVIEERMAEFVARRGKSGVTFERIFHLPIDHLGETPHLDEEARAVILRQLAIGVEVRVHPSGEFPREMFLVDGSATIAWHVVVDADFRIAEVQATCDESKVQLYQDKVFAVHAASRRIVRDARGDLVFAPR